VLVETEQSLVATAAEQKLLGFLLFFFFIFFFRKLMPLSRICERSSAEVQQKTAEAQS